MVGDAGVNPALELGGQIKDFDGHRGSPLQALWLPVGSRRSAKGRQLGVGRVHSNPDDRFQYLSVNIL
jgi:hypothetical protein